MNIKVIYGKMLTGLGKLCGVDCAKKFDTQLRFHRNLNLKNPKSLADKVTLHRITRAISTCPRVYR